MSSRLLIDVTARCVARNRDKKTAVEASKTLAGWVTGLPTVGMSLVIFRPGDGGRTITSPVLRVLGDADGKTLYVETLNSIYYVTLSTALHL
ncbi:MAG TPA: hypothetical protein VL326_25840 [Kofleriaceae bacterium]|jgi:hypothetical protein|nr:hypothetical protein [Kofleriaceae bacterium]